MNIDLSMREYAFLIAALTDRQVKLRSEIQLFTQQGEGDWAVKSQAELDDISALKERVWNA